MVHHSDQCHLSIFFLENLLTTQLLSVYAAESEVVYRNRDGDVLKFNVATNETDVLLRNSTFVSFL